MTLDQLRIFVAAAERLNMTRAASDLSLSQSTVSHAIGALELQYRTKLFNRIGRSIVLTRPGNDFLQKAREVLGSAAAAQRLLMNASALRRGSLSLAASQTVANYWLPCIMQHFRLRYPGITLKLDIRNSMDVADSVAGGSVEIGFIEEHINIEGIDAHPVARDELVLITGTSHPWARCDTLPSHSALQENAWVVREPGSAIRRIFEKTLRELGIEPDSLDIALELPTNEAVRVAVEAGAGAALMSRRVAQAAAHAGSIAVHPWWTPTRDFLMLWPQCACPSDAAAAFARLARE